MDNVAKPTERKRQMVADLGGYTNIEYDGGVVTVFEDDGEIGIEFNDPNDNVIPLEVVMKIVTVWISYGWNE